MVHHGIHTARNREEHSRLAKLLEVAQVIAPVRLREYCHAQTFVLEKATDHGMPKTRVVHVGVRANDNHIDIVPAEFLQVFFADG